MTLRADALAAYQAAQSGREGDARAVLADVLASESQAVLDALTVADVETGAGFVRYVLTDGDVHLAVVLRDSGNSVHLVTGAPGDWTDRASIGSLSELGEVLPGIVPPPPPASGPAAWVPGKAYASGDEVTYAGTTYVCGQPHTSQVGWEPPNVPALWSKVA